MLRDVISGTDSVRYPALQARARWSLGNVLLRGETAEEAMRQAQASARLFLRGNDRENAAGSLTVLTDAYFALERQEDGYRAAHLATTHLRSYPGSVRLHTLLAALSRNVEAHGFPASALHLQNEGVAVARRNGRPAHRSEALIARARLLAARGDVRGADRDLHEAFPLIRSLRPGYARDWLLADVSEVDAAVQMKLSNPRGALAAADSATGYFLRIELPFRQVATLRRAAEAALTLGDRAAAKDRLTAGLRILEQRRDSMERQAGRAAVFDVERGLTDRLVLLELADGRTARALDVMDRARASLAAAGSPRGGGRTALSGPAGEVVAQYARIADTLLVWTARGSRVDVYRTVVDTLALAREAGDLESVLERRSGGEALRPALARLYALLVRPVEARLGEAGTPVVIVADGELATVPFAALYDAGTRRYLVEDHPIRFAVSLREAKRPRRDRAAAAPLFVADPAFERATHSLLGALPRTRAGVRAMAAGYRGAVVVEGSAATERAFVAALGRAGMVHFGGHAVFDDTRPDSSFLVLAPERGRAGSGELRAARIAELDLRHVRLVVLAACRTQRKGGSRGGGYSGLSGALRAAGAGATLGSTWSVDERLTGALMTEFHRAYRASGDGPRALRQAQLALLHSPDPALRSPAAWAGFQYAGR